MGYQIDVSTYELKTNLSKYLRALDRGDVDIVMIERYGRKVGVMLPFNLEKPGLSPETKGDISMRARARYVETGLKPRRSRS